MFDHPILAVEQHKN